MDVKYVDFIVDFSEGQGILLVSEVEKPASQLNFHLFSEESELTNFSVNNVEMKMAGPIIVTDKWIWRSEIGGYGRFTKEMTKAIHENWMETGNLFEANVNHGKGNFGDQAPPTYWLEVWSVEDPEMDKSRLYGFTGDRALKKGDLFGIKKAKNNEEGKKYWKEWIESGKIKGFSPQFDLKSFKTKESEMEKNEQELANFAQETETQVEKSIETQDGNATETETKVETQIEKETESEDSEFIKKEEIDALIKDKVSEALVDLSTRFDALEGKLNEIMMEKNKLAEENAALKEAEAEFSEQIKDLKSTIPGNFNSNTVDMPISKENMSPYQKFREDMKKWRKN